MPTPSGDAGVDPVVRQLKEALDSRVVIEQAKGMIAVQCGLPVADAFEKLRLAGQNRVQREFGLVGKKTLQSELVLEQCNERVRYGINQSSSFGAPAFRY